MAEITPEEARRKLIIPPDDELRIVVVSRAPGLTQEEQAVAASGIVATFANLGKWSGLGQIDFITQTEFLKEEPS